MRVKQLRTVLTRTILWVVFASALGACASPGPVQAAESPSANQSAVRKAPTTYHATAYVRGSMGIRVIDYWSRGASMRARTLIGGHPIITLVQGDRYAAIDLFTRKGIQIRRSPSAIQLDGRRVRPFAFELDDIVRDGGEKVEDMSIGSMDAEIWQVRDGHGRRKVWVSASEPRVPLRIETFSRAAGDTHQVDYSNWVFDLELPAEFFSIPAGIQLETLEYEEFGKRAAARSLPPVPILYPDLVHGVPLN